MKTSPPILSDATTRIPVRVPKTMLSVLVGLAFIHVGGWAARGGKVGPLPATPILATPGLLLRGATYSIDIAAASVDGSAFNAGKGSKTIQAAFSGTGITVNSITNVTDTMLTLSATIAVDAAFGDRSLTVTNPDDQTTTSSDGIVRIIDIPVISSATINPSTPSGLDPLEALVTGVSNLDGTPVTFLYQWHENGAAIAHTLPTLPADATTCGYSYHCLITPAKGSVTGTPFSTASVLIPIDYTNNGIPDEWEIAYFASVASDIQADADGDGVSNQAEFLFGLKPTDSRSRNAIRQPLQKNTGRFSYSRSLLATGARYKVWISTNLTDWFEQLPMSETRVESDSETEVVEIQLPAALTSNPRLFVRVSAE